MQISPFAIFCLFCGPLVLKKRFAGVIIFSERKKGTAEKINLQRDGNKAKPYQVKQVREIFVALGVRENDDA
jgi:hypothetical protein